jgi:hypothetical protein
MLIELIAPMAALEHSNCRSSLAGSKVAGQEACEFYFFSASVFCRSSRVFFLASSAD